MQMVQSRPRNREASSFRVNFQADEKEGKAEEGGGGDAKSELPLTGAQDVCLQRGPGTNWTQWSGRCGRETLSQSVEGRPHAHRYFLDSAKEVPRWNLPDAPSRWGPSGVGTEDPRPNRDQGPPKPP